jgi:rod shape-determining protein MreD
VNKTERIKNLRVAVLFTATFAVILFVRLIPLDLMPGQIAPPDILFALLVGLLVRRPRAVPMVLVVGLFLLNDILLQKPLGLWTLVVFAISELVRSSRNEVREMLFLSEWVWFAGLYGAASAAHLALRIVLFIPRDPLTLVLPMIIFTIAVYPLVVLFLNLVFGVQKPVRRDFAGMSAR